MSLHLKQNLVHRTHLIHIYGVNMIFLQPLAVIEVNINNKEKELSIT